MALIKEEIVAMSVAAIAEKLHMAPNKIKVLSFSEVQKSGLEIFIEKNNINYQKYQLGDIIR